MAVLVLFLASMAAAAIAFVFLARGFGEAKKPFLWWPMLVPMFASGAISRLQTNHDPPSPDILTRVAISALAYVCLAFMIKCSGVSIWRAALISLIVMALLLTWMFVIPWPQLVAGSSP